MTYLDFLFYLSISLAIFVTAIGVYKLTHKKGLQ